MKYVNNEKMYVACGRVQQEREREATSIVKCRNWRKQKANKSYDTRGRGRSINQKVKKTTTKIVTQRDIHTGMLKEGTRAAIHLHVSTHFVSYTVDFIVFFYDTTLTKQLWKTGQIQALQNEIIYKCNINSQLFSNAQDDLRKRPFWKTGQEKEMCHSVRNERCVCVCVPRFYLKWKYVA